MTLFTKWADAHNKPPLPVALRQQENPYLACLKLAEVREKTFDSRNARRVRAWFESHPACNQMLLPLDWRDVDLRGSEMVDVEARHGRGWFDKATGVRVYFDSQTLEIKEDDRPEHRLEQRETYNDALALATALGSAAYRREILEEFPLTVKNGALVNKNTTNKKKAKLDNKQLELDLSM